MTTLVPSHHRRLSTGWRPFPAQSGRFVVARLDPTDKARPGHNLRVEHSRTPAGAIRSFPTESIALGVCRLLNGEFDRA